MSVHRKWVTVGLCATRSQPVHTPSLTFFIYLTFCQCPLQLSLTWKQPLACSRQAETLGPVLKERRRRQAVATCWLRVAKVPNNCCKVVCLLLRLSHQTKVSLGKHRLKPCRQHRHRTRPERKVQYSLIYITSLCLRLNTGTERGWGWGGKGQHKLTNEMKEVNKKNLKPLAAGMDGALKEPRCDVPLPHPNHKFL